MPRSCPYLRSFLVGAVWFSLVAIKMVSRHPGPWSTYPPQNFVVLGFGWVITALIWGVLATRFEILRSWICIVVGTMGASLAVLAAMVFTANRISERPSLPDFKSTDEMMAHFANEAKKWVKTDRNVDLDYSLESIKTIDEELLRLSRDIDKANPQRGTV